MVNFEIYKAASLVFIMNLLPCYFPATMNLLAKNLIENLMAPNIVEFYKILNSVALLCCGLYNTKK